jgi:hypothetical protein
MNSCNRYCARLEILTAVNIQIKVFFDVTPCSLVEIYPHFRATCPVREKNIFNAKDEYIRKFIPRNTAQVYLKWVRVRKLYRKGLEEFSFGFDQAVQPNLI